MKNNFRYEIDPATSEEIRSLEDDLNRIIIEWTERAYPVYSRIGYGAPLEPEKLHFWHILDTLIPILRQVCLALTDAMPGAPSKVVEDLVKSLVGKAMGLVPLSEASTSSTVTGVVH